MSPLPAWPRSAVIYQIYPKSFRDASGDGVGDLKGITEKLGYIADLGADAVWLSPIFASPMVDNGYDVSDYCAVNPLFGTITDFDALIAEANRRGLKIVLDLALNHTSTAHPWFQASLADPTGPYGEFYFWRPIENGRFPNNWRSVFGGPAWTEAAPGRAYLHLFDRTQADLNWDNPQVRSAIQAAVRFWLERGVAGFRLDVVSLISKDPALPDMPDGLTLLDRYRILAQGPNLHAYLRELRATAFDPFGAAAIGEAPGLDPAGASLILDPEDPMLDLIYHFDFVEPKRDAAGAIDVPAFKRTLAAWDKGVGPRCWNTTVLSNHDLGRLPSRLGNAGRYRYESATALLTVLLTLRATPFLYQGDELGLVDCAFDSLDQLDDVWAKTAYRLAREKGLSHEEAFARAVAVTRDHARTPFPWEPGPSLGFSPSAHPWLMANPAHAALTACAQSKDPGSVLSYAKKAIALRRSDRLWREGAWRDLAPAHPRLLVFERRLENRRGLVAVNLHDGEADWDALPSATPALANWTSPSGRLRPFEARIWA